jgi:hypothetical protein
MMNGMFGGRRRLYEYLFSSLLALGLAFKRVSSMLGVTI